MEQKQSIYIMKALFVGGMAFGSPSLNSNNKHIWMYSIVRYVLYILTIRAMYGACVLTHDVIRHKRAIDAQLLQKIHRNHVIMFLAAVAVLLFNDQTFIDTSFFMILIATVITKYQEVPFSQTRNNLTSNPLQLTLQETGKKKILINYGVGMACSYFEGYLVHILPSNRTKPFGFLNDIRVYEAKQGVVFPVKKLFIVTTKSLYSPPSLEKRPDRDDVAYLEACSKISNVQKDVAGVKSRTYKSFAYKIYRPGAPPVCLSVSGGTPLYTLSRVLKNRELSGELSGINREEIVAEFIDNVCKLIEKSPECRGKCELICYDDTNPDLNLADVLLSRIRELEPNFEEIITQEVEMRETNSLCLETNI